MPRLKAPLKFRKLLRLRKLLTTADSGSRKAAEASRKDEAKDEARGEVPTKMA